MHQTTPRTPGHQEGPADSLAAPVVAGGLGGTLDDFDDIEFVRGTLNTVEAGTFECIEDSTGRCVNPAHRHRPSVELVPIRQGEFGKWLRACHALAFGWTEVGNLRGYQA